MEGPCFRLFPHISTYFRISAWGDGCLEISHSPVQMPAGIITLTLLWRCSQYRSVAAPHGDQPICKR